MSRFYGHHSPRKSQKAAYCGCTSRERNIVYVQQHYCEVVVEPRSQQYKISSRGNQPKSTLQSREIALLVQYLGDFSSSDGHSADHRWLSIWLSSDHVVCITFGWEEPIKANQFWWDCSVRKAQHLAKID